jgi:hypothetical protein
MEWQIIDQQGKPAMVTEEQLRALLRTGHLKRSTLLWGEGLTDWTPAEEARPDLFPALHKAAVPSAHGGAPPVVVVPPQPVEAVAARGRRIVKRPRSEAPKSGMMKWVIILLVLGLAAGITKILTQPKPPGFDALHEAEAALTESKTRGSGDSPGEKRAATVMAETAEALRDAGISSGSSKFGRGKAGLVRRAAAAMDANGFTAVCSVRGDTAVFLLHVPDLRKFSDDAKTAMGKMAWFAARTGWMELPEPRPARICAAIKGIASYDRAVEGPAAAPAVGDDDEITFDLLGSGIQQTISGGSDVLTKVSGYFRQPAGKKAK